MPSDPLSTINWESVGRRLALLRERKGLSIREVATRADVDKNTVLRIERGLPVRYRSLNQICAALETSVGRQLLEIAEPDEGFRVSRANDRKWVRARARSKSGSNSLESNSFDDREARWKIGWSGLEPIFNGLIDCELYGGNIVASVVEVFGSIPRQKHAGEEFLFCLRGPVLVWVGRESLRLETGDAVCLWASASHSFGPAAPVGPKNAPALLLSVRADANRPGPALSNAMT